MLSSLSVDVIYYLYFFLKFRDVFHLAQCNRFFYKISYSFTPWVNTRQRVRINLSADWLCSADLKFLCTIVHEQNDLPLLKLILDRDSPKEKTSRIDIAYNQFALVGKEDVLSWLMTREIFTGPVWVAMVGKMIKGGHLPLANKYIFAYRDFFYKRTYNDNWTIKFRAWVHSACKNKNKSQRLEAMSMLYTLMKNWNDGEEENNIFKWAVSYVLNFVLETKDAELLHLHESQGLTFDPVSMCEAACEAGRLDVFLVYEPKTTKLEYLSLIERALAYGHEDMLTYLMPKYKIPNDRVFLSRAICKQRPWSVGIFDLLLTHNPQIFKSEAEIYIRRCGMETIEYFDSKGIYIEPYLFGILACKSRENFERLVLDPRFEWGFYLGAICKKKRWDLLEECLKNCTKDDIQMVLDFFKPSYPILYHNDFLIEARGGIIQRAEEKYTSQSRNLLKKAGIDNCVIASNQHYRNELATLCIAKRLGDFLGIQDFWESLINNEKIN